MIKPPDILLRFSKSIGRIEFQLNLRPGIIDELSAILGQFQRFLGDFEDFVNGAKERVSTRTLDQISQGLSLIDVINSAAVRDFKTTEDPDVFTLIEVLTDSEDALRQILAMPAFFQVDAESPGSPKAGSVEYVVLQNDTPESIGLKVNGDPESWIEIAKFNDLNLDVVGSQDVPDGWVGLILDIPRVPGFPIIVSPDKDNDVLDSPKGLRALGRDFPNALKSDPRSDGFVELAILEGANNLLQGLSNRLLTPLGGITDLPLYGSRSNELLGRDYGPITGRVIELDLQQAILADGRVLDIVSFQSTLEGAVIDIQFQVRLINGITTNTLRASFKPGDVV